MLGKQERNYDKVQSTSLVYQGIKSLDSLVPSNKRKESTRGLLFLVDTNTNKCLSISFWETETEGVS